MMMTMIIMMMMAIFIHYIKHLLWFFRFFVIQYWWVSSTSMNERFNLGYVMNNVWKVCLCCVGMEIITRITRIIISFLIWFLASSYTLFIMSIVWFWITGNLVKWFPKLISSYSSIRRVFVYSISVCDV